MFCIGIRAKKRPYTVNFMYGYYLFIAFIIISLSRRPCVRSPERPWAQAASWRSAAPCWRALAGIACAGSVLLGDGFDVPLFSSGSAHFHYTSTASSAFFLLMISLLSLIVSIYSFGYVKEYEGQYSMGLMGFLYNMFILSMALVVTAHNAVLFLIFWEAMSLLSYALVVYENRNKNAARSGFIYIVMTHVGTAFIMHGAAAARRTIRAPSTLAPLAGTTMPDAPEERGFPIAPGRVRHQGRHDSAARLAALCASGRSEQHFRADVGRDGENGHLHADPLYFRFSGRDGYLVGPAGIIDGVHIRRPGRAVCARWRPTSSGCWPTRRWRTWA